MKKLIICIFVLMLILSQPSFAKASSTELKQHWAASLMEDWMSKGILKGYEDGKVYPDRSITRAEFLKLLHKGFDNKNSYDTSKLKNQFKDISSKNWYYNDVLQAVNEGFIKGYPNNTFQPNKTLTRQEAAVILANKLNLKEDKLDLLKEYTDSNTVATWANTSFAGVLNHSVLTGYPNKTLMPKKQLTRAEAVTLLDKAITYQSPTTNPKPVVDDTTTGSPSSAFTSFGGGGSKTISKGINTIDLKLDSDKDGLPDYMEESIGTDKNNPDSDGDGLTDGQEVNRVGTSPLKADTDGNGIKDGLEDSDHDGLNNIKEMKLNTDPNSKDSDFDGWDDGLEVEKGTNPLKADTDNDGLDDSIEENFGMNPLIYDTNGNGIKDGDENVIYKTEIASYESDPYVTPSVKIASKAKQADTTVITNVYGEDAFINKSIAGYIGAPYEFTTDVKFDTAEMTFEYDPSLQSSDFEPAIFYYNKDKQLLEKVPNQTYNPTTHSVTAIVKHFSTYILLNKKKWDTSWEEDMPKPNTKNSTGSDYVFAIDASPSMVDNDPKNIRLKAVSNFVDKLKPEDRAAVVKFDMSSSTVLKLTSNKATVQKAVYSMDLGSGTNLYAGLKRGINELNSSDSSRNKYIIFLTDGEGNYQNQYVDSAAFEAKSKDIIIYTIGLSPAVKTEVLQGIADKTGGKYLYAEEAETLDLVYDNVAKETVDLSLDTDHDGLPDYFEINGVRLGNSGWIRGLDPNNPDTDNDGVKDGDELEWIEDKENPDFIYFTIKSDPTQYDTDEDSVNDKIDQEPLIYNLRDRHAVLAAELSYVNLESLVGSNLGSLNDSAINERFQQKTDFPDQKMTPHVYEELNGWRIIKASDSNLQSYGLGAVALKRGNTIMFAFRGTEIGNASEALTDVGADLNIFIINNNLMVYQSEGFVASVLKENPNSKIYNVGHSLGGYLSTVMSYELISLNLDRSKGNLGAYGVFDEKKYDFIKGKNFNPAPLFISGYVTQLFMDVSGLDNILPYPNSAIPFTDMLNPSYDDKIETFWIDGEFLSVATYFAGGLRIGTVHAPFKSSEDVEFISPMESLDRHGIANFYAYFPKPE